MCLYSLPNVYSHLLWHQNECCELYFLPFSDQNNETCKSLKYIAVLVSVLLLKETLHYQGNSNKRKHLNGGLLTVSEAYSIIIMEGSMVACWWTWWWRSIWELHSEERGGRGNLALTWAFEPQSPSPMTHFLQQHNS